MGRLISTSPPRQGESCPLPFIVSKRPEPAATAASPGKGMPDSQNATYARGAIGNMLTSSALQIRPQLWTTFLGVVSLSI
jgi:hypothetical protein